MSVSLPDPASARSGGGALPAALGLLQRDLLLARRSPQEILHPLGFLLMVVTLFPLALGPDPDRLALVAPGVVWIAALLATLLSLDFLFHGDAEDGSLEQLLIAPQPLYLLVLVKILAHWLASNLPLVIAAPLLGGMLYLETEARVALFLSLLIGTPVLSLIGSIAAALVVRVGQGSFLMTLLVLPLYLPVIIFGAAAVTAAAGGLAYSGHLALLGAMLALAVVLCPLAAAAALRIGIDN